jgi:hypothetical protein
MKATAIGLVVVATALVAGGCGLLEDPSPEEARLVVHGDAGKPVRLIISTKFVAAVDELGRTRVVIFEADTLVTTLPYESAYTIEEDQRFFAEAARLDSDLESVRMEVYVDRRKQFEEGGMLLAGQPYRFVYTFNQRMTQEIVVI